MKEVLLLTVFTLLVYTASGERRYNKLKFGQTENDYILFQTDMSPFETGFTLCSWIRKLYTLNHPTWFSYAVSDQAFELQIGDDGVQTYIFGSNTNLASYYTVTPGNWFHNCMSWDAATRTRNIYIDGVLVDSRSTPENRTLKQGGSILLGNEQDSGPGAGMDKHDIFGGEMYNLNMFSRKLTDSEIQEMARERCSEVEDQYGEVRRLKWEDILLKERTGNVTEIGSGCSAVDSVRYSYQLAVRKLTDTKNDLEKCQVKAHKLEVLLKSIQKLGKFNCKIIKLYN